MTAVLGALAFGTAGINLWLRWVRPRQPEHLYLAICSLGIGMLAASFVVIYEAATPEVARLGQQLGMTSVIPLILGFLRFTAHFLDVELRWLERPCQAFCAAMVLTCWLFPGAIFSGEVWERELLFSNETHLEMALTALGHAIFPTFLLVFAALVGVFARHAHMGSGERRVVVGALGLWFLSSCHDAAVVAGWVSGPFLIVFGYLGFSLAFTAVLLRRFARALEHVEENADVLHRLVEEQTAELRRRELALAHGERMATLGTLAAGVAHEINNPIAFVSSNLNHLAEAWKQGDDEPVEDILAETREGVDRIRGIVVELLSLARRGDGRNERVDLNQVVQSVLPLLRHQALDRARLETQLTDLPPVLGDPGLLGQVVLNLALNSLHAMESGSPRSNCLTLSTAFEDGSVWLMVRDTGAGIPDEVLPHIFDPFFTTKEQGKGTGLGLAVTHQIVTRHRGRLDVETGETGTTITVELPPDTGFASAETAAGR